MNKEALLEDVRKALDIWNGMAVRLQNTLVVFGGLATICSLSLTAFVGSKWMDDTTIRIVSFMSTLFLTLLAIFGVAAKGNNSRKAWRHLNHALLLYYAGKITEEELAIAKHEGEVILGSVNFSPNVSTQKPAPIE